MEAIEAKARERREAKSHSHAPLTTETVRPILSDIVSRSVKKALEPMLSRFDRQDSSISELCGRVASIDYVSLVYSLQCLHVVYKYGLAAGGTQRHHLRPSPEWSKDADVGHAVAPVAHDHAVTHAPTRNVATTHRLSSAHRSESSVRRRLLPRVESASWLTRCVTDRSPRHTTRRTQVSARHRIFSRRDALPCYTHRSQVPPDW